MEIFKKILRINKSKKLKVLSLAFLVILITLFFPIHFPLFSDTPQPGGIGKGFPFPIFYQVLGYKGEFLDNTFNNGVLFVLGLICFVYDLIFWGVVFLLAQRTLRKLKALNQIN